MDELRRLEESYKEMGKRIEELKAKNGLPKTWEDFCEHNWDIADTNIINTLPEYVALFKLECLRDAYNGDWVPDWENKYENRYVFYFFGNRITTGFGNQTQSFFAFKTAELRDEFLNNFRDLIMEAKPLL